MGAPSYRLILPRQMRAERRALPSLEARAPAPEISLVVPAYNEAPNIEPLVARVAEALAGRRWELILVDDGSMDGTADAIQRSEDADERVRGVSLVINSGQTAATAAGIAVARAPLLATLDADLQNDPADLPAMWAALGGHDAVVGYRVRRQDSALRRASSRIANAVRNRLTGDQIRDTGCALKLFRSDAISSLPLFEGMHRFLPTLLRIHGFSVIEVPVSHHARAAGRAKYGVWNRVFCALRDAFAVRWMRARVIRLPLATPSDSQR